MVNKDPVGVMSPQQQRENLLNLVQKMQRMQQQQQQVLSNGPVQAVRFGQELERGCGLDYTMQQCRGVYAEEEKGGPFTRIRFDSYHPSESKVTPAYKRESCHLVDDDQPLDFSCSAKKKARLVEEVDSPSPRDSRTHDGGTKSKSDTQDGNWHRPERSSSSEGYSSHSPTDSDPTPTQISSSTAPVGLHALGDRVVIPRQPLKLPDLSRHSLVAEKTEERHGLLTTVPRLLNSLPVPMTALQYMKPVPGIAQLPQNVSPKIPTTVMSTLPGSHPLLVQALQRKPNQHCTGDQDPFGSRLLAVANPALSINSAVPSPPSMLINTTSHTSLPNAFPNLPYFQPQIGSPLPTTGPPLDQNLEFSRVNQQSHAKFSEFRQQMLNKIEAANTHSQRRTAVPAAAKAFDGKVDVEATGNPPIEAKNRHSSPAGSSPSSTEPAEETKVGRPDGEEIEQKSDVREDRSQADTTGLSTGIEGNKTRRNSRGSIPEEMKDQAYWERRRKNNDAAKRSRDTRRMKENEIAVRASFLEQENIQLKVELVSLRSEITELREQLTKEMFRSGE